MTKKLKTLSVLLCILFIGICTKIIHAQTLNQDDLVVIAVIDTGIVKDNVDMGNYIIDAENFNDEDKYPIDSYGHGTAVAGTIRSLLTKVLPQYTQISGKVKIMVLKTNIGRQQVDVDQRTADAIEYAIDKGADIINMSFTGDQEHFLKTIEVMKKEESQDVLFIVSAGNGTEINGWSTGESNNHEENNVYPCDIIFEEDFDHDGDIEEREGNIICVAALEDKDNLTGWSDYGNKTVDIAASGNYVKTVNVEKENIFNEDFQKGDDINPISDEDSLSKFSSESMEYWEIEQIDGFIRFGLSFAKEIDGEPVLYNPRITLKESLDTTDYDGLIIDYGVYCTSENQSIVLQLKNKNGEWITMDTINKSKLDDMGWDPNFSVAPDYRFFLDLSVDDIYDGITESDFFYNGFQFRFQYENIDQSGQCLISQITLNAINGKDDIYEQEISGTSFSAPYISTLAGLIMVDENLSVLDLKDRLFGYAVINDHLKDKIVDGKTLTLDALPYFEECLNIGEEKCEDYVLYKCSQVDSVSNVWEGVGSCDSDLKEIVEISGSLETQTWTNDTVYVINEHAILSENNILTIDPGTIVKFKEWSDIQVNGELYADGAIFTSINDKSYYGPETEIDPKEGDYEGIVVYEGGYAEIKNSIFKYGGGDASWSGVYDNGVIKTYGGKLDISDNVFESLEIGIYIEDSLESNISNNTFKDLIYECIRTETSDVSINNNVFKNDLSFAIVETGTTGEITNNTFEDVGSFIHRRYPITLAYSTPTLYGNKSVGDKNNVIFISEIKDDEETHIYKTDHMVYDLGLAIPTTSTLTIHPGVIVKTSSSNDPRLINKGVLNVNGTYNEPVIFTSYKDDIYGGDTDGQPDTPALGDWGGIEVQEGGVVYMDNAVLKYGVDDNSVVGEKDSLMKILGGKVYINNSDFSYSDYGIYVEQGQGEITNNIFSDIVYQPIIITDSDITLYNNKCVGCEEKIYEDFFTTLKSQLFDVFIEGTWDEEPTIEDGKLTFIEEKLAVRSINQNDKRLSNYRQSLDINLLSGYTPDDIPVEIVSVGRIDPDTKNYYMCSGSLNRVHLYKVIDGEKSLLTETTKNEDEFFVRRYNDYKTELEFDGNKISCSMRDADTQVSDTWDIEYRDTDNPVMYGYLGLAANASKVQFDNLEVYSYPELAKDIVYEDYFIDDKSSFETILEQGGWSNDPVLIPETGKLEFTNQFWTVRSLLGTGNYSDYDQELDIDFLSDYSPQGYIGVVGRINGNKFYAAIATQNKVYLYKVDNDSWEKLCEIEVPDLYIKRYSKYVTHLQFRGNTIRFKVWDNGEEEPTDWMIEYTDLDAPIEEGKIGLAGYYSKTQFDNWIIY